LQLWQTGLRKEQLMAILDVKKSKDWHEHKWELTTNLSEKKCACGKIGVSSREFERREIEWNAYYEHVRENTVQGRDFQAMVKAKDQRNKKAMKEIMVRIEERNSFETDEVITAQGERKILKYGFEPKNIHELTPKPPFPDTHSNAYVIIRPETPYQLPY
jgi:hypothetical protein